MNRRQFLAAVTMTPAIALEGIADGAQCPTPNCANLWTTNRPTGCDASCNPWGKRNPITIADFGCGLSGKPPWIDFQLTPQTVCKRRRWSKIDPIKDRAYLADLKNAYCLVRALPDTDKRSLQRQAWLHEFYCTNWPPGDIHNSWAFLPWHRGFLYFHEKILASLLCKPDFRLPVWDWETPGNSWIPHFYQKLGIPTFLVGNWGRNKTDATKGYWINQCVLQAWLFGSTFEGFMGSQPCREDPCILTPPCPDPAIPGWATHAAHSSGHVICGGAMATIPASAADPLFYSHHANVDRYWHWWKQYNSDKIPIPQAFLNQSLFFYDEQQRLVRVRASQLMDETGLGYSYDLPATPWCPLESVDLMEDTTAKLTALTVGAVLSAEGVAFGTLKIAEEIASGNLAIMHNSCLQSVPARIHAKLISGPPPAPGVYYLVQMTGDQQSAGYNVGGFGIFAGSHQHGSGSGPHIAIAACIDDILWNQLLQWKGNRYLTFATPDGRATGVEGPITKLEITGFDLLVPEGLLAKGTAWLKEHDIKL